MSVRTLLVVQRVGLDQQRYSTPGPVSTGMGDHVQGSTPGARNLSQYITSHPGQLSLAIPPWIGSEYNCCMRVLLLLLLLLLSHAV